MAGHADAAVHTTRIAVLVNVCRCTTRGRVHYDDMLRLLADVSYLSAILQLSTLVLIMASGHPGIYVRGVGFMYVSNNFCHQQFLAALFILFTVPSWALLACSICRVESLWSLWLLALPLPMGLGVVLFPICSTVWMHYFFVNGFVFAVGSVHLVVAYTGNNVAFIRMYPAIVIGTAVCGAIFMVFALLDALLHEGHGILRDIATILEYAAVLGFVFINSVSCDRIREHIKITGPNPEGLQP
jgi:hypothetical protein